MTEVALIMIRHNNRYLLIQRSLEDEYGGLWAMPGGKKDSSDQSIYQAAERELEEETGLVSQHLEELLTTTKEQYHIHLFMCTLWSGNPSLICKDVIGVGWFTIPEIWQLDKSLTPWLLSFLSDLTFSIRHDHKYRNKIDD